MQANSPAHKTFDPDRLDARDPELIIPDAGHALSLEAPELTAERVLAHVTSEVDGRSVPA